MATVDEQQRPKFGLVVACQRAMRNDIDISHCQPSYEAKRSRCGCRSELQKRIERMDEATQRVDHL